MKTTRRLRFYVETFFLSVVTLLIVRLLLNILLSFDFLNPMGESMDDFSISDIFFRIESSSEVKTLNDEIAIIDISDVYDRSELADIIAKTEQYFPKAIGLDIIFEGIKDDKDGNEKLIDVIRGNDNIVVANKLTQFNETTEVFQNKIFNFFEADSLVLNVGYVNLTIDNANQVVRDFSFCRSFEDTIMPSFSNKIFSVAYHRDPINHDDLFINFEDTEFFTVEADKIDEYREFLQNKIILLGAVSDESDTYFTPIGRIPGVVIHAHSIDSMFAVGKVKNLPEWMNLLIALLLIFVALLLTDKLDDWCDNRVIIKFWDGPFRFVFITIFLLVVLYADYLLYVHLHIYVELANCLLGIGIADSVREVYSSLLNTLAALSNGKASTFLTNSSYKND